MNSSTPRSTTATTLAGLAALALLPLAAGPVQAAAPTLLFEDQFNTGIPGWTAVQPPGNYIDGPLLWQYDVISQSFLDQGNIYTDAAGFSVTRIAPMLINDTVAPANFTYTARLVAGDDDGFGLIWGYQNSDTFYRVSFGRQARTGWPFTGWAVDRLNGGQITDLAGAGTPGHTPSFINTSGRPFDVTITVLNDLLDITVVDDPLGTPTPYTLDSGVPLPGSTGGKVGIFTWGQQSTGAPRGFQIKNLVLAPTPLTGDLSTVLSGWTFLITPRANGTTALNNGGPPNWSLAAGASGNTGALVENSDAFASGDNAAAGTTNYAAPSAVAGDVSWSNYVCSARFTSDDDDGFGMLLRYVNETNFYRIGFRGQNSTAGVKRGISGQKSVDRVFDQIFASTAFVPSVSTPIDVHASIRGDRLQIIVISNPEGANSQGYFFGPFDITGPTISTGKVGVFSWAQFNGGTAPAGKAGTQVDFVKVQEVAGEGLIVASAYGTPNIPLGLNDFPLNTLIDASVDSPVVTSPGVRRVCTGWNGSGSVPASGATTMVSFTLTTFSFIEWKWRTEYQLTLATSGGGQVSTAAGAWVPDGSNVTVTAMPNAGHIFLGWSGASASTVPALAFPMLRPVSLTAVFAPDSDGDGLSDTWENEHFGDLDEVAAGDPDGDGVSTGDEFARGTDPDFAEALVVSDGLSSQWINTQRDPALPGQLGVVDFGSGYRGAFDVSNDYRFGNDATFVNATNLSTNYASFQSPRVVVRTNLWDPAWENNFEASLEFTVGDNDGSCFYFRYVDEQNWYRVTLCGENAAGNTTRPRRGISVQSRVNGNYADIPNTWDEGIFPDPLDTTGFKRIKLTVTASGSDFQVRAIGWNTLLPMPIFDPNFERAITFNDTNHLTGRIGFGLWGQGGFGDPNATNGIPVPSGALVDNIVLKVSDTTVFSENWETAPLTNDLPAGWLNPYAGLGPVSQEGNWEVSAHGTIMQLSNAGADTTGSATDPKADADGPVLLAPDAALENYLLEIGFHPFDNDGIGLVYNFVDTNNFSRVLFVAAGGGAGGMPAGLSVSRKANGVWTDIVAGDPSFIYTPGQPFGIALAKSGGQVRLKVWNLDTPGSVVNWQWADTSVDADTRFGLATWFEQDAHCLYARAYSMPDTVITIPLEITNISLNGGNVVLDITRPAGSMYHVLRSATVSGGYAPVALNQSGAQYSEPAPAGTVFYRLQLAP